MSEAVLERPALRVPFRWLVAVALGLAVVAFFGGRHIYHRYGGYRPLALMHVPQTMRYRARINLKDDPRRLAAAGLIFRALDGRQTRGPALERQLGAGFHEAARELAFGVGEGPGELVVVVGFKLDDSSTLRLAKSVCEAAAADGLGATATDRGCRLADGSLIAATLDGSVLLASQPSLVKDLLGRAEIGDRLGFAGPSVRGAAPELKQLEDEASKVAATLSSRYP